MADHLKFDALSYLRSQYSDVYDQRGKYMLDNIYSLLQRYRGRQDLRVLDFGSGPVIQNCISAAAFASEVVFCDISPANREAIQKWLDRDTDAFDWSPHFDYVVKTLEGRSEEEAREREERMRKVARVVFADALSEQPLAKGDDGPFDLILQCGCLEAACSDKRSFERGIRVLTSLLKSGGLLVDLATDAPVDTLDLTYNVGGTDHHCIRLTGDYVASIMRGCGLKDVEAKFFPLEQKSCIAGITSEVPKGFHAVNGRKE